MSDIIINTPITEEQIKSLKPGQMVYITGTVYTGRDAAHKRMVEMIENGEKPPFDFEGQVIYYVGPAPNKPGYVIGPAGPTTSLRMDAYSPLLINEGLKFMIGKGTRNDEVKDAIKENTGMYFAAVGGAAAVISQSIKEAEVIAFDDLGTEAIRKLTVEKMPVIVAVDSQGNSVYDRD